MKGFDAIELSWESNHNWCYQIKDSSIIHQLNNSLYTTFGEIYLYDKQQEISIYKYYSSEYNDIYCIKYSGNYYALHSQKNQDKFSISINCLVGRDKGLNLEKFVFLHGAIMSIHDYDNNVIINRINEIIKTD